MYSVSEEFKVAVRSSHRIITKAEIIRDDQLIGVIYPEAGLVEIDARRAQRRTCSVSLHAGGRELVYLPVYNTYATFGTSYASYTAINVGVASYADSQSVVSYSVSSSDEGLIPDSGLDLLTPYGNELRLFRGITYRKLTNYTYAQLSAAYSTYDTATFRTNLVTNPSFETNTTGWSLQNGATVARITSDFLFDTACAQVTSSATSYNNIASNLIPVTAGLQYTLSAYAKNVSGSARGVYVAIGWFTSGGVQISETNSAGQGSLAAASGWTIRNCTGTAPATATQAKVVLLSGQTGLTAGWLTNWDGVLFEQASSVGTYFDGSYPDGLWSGTAHNSSSSRVVYSMDRRNLWTNPSVETTIAGYNTAHTIARSTDYAHKGTASAKVTLSASTDSNVIYFTPNVPSGNITFSMYLYTPVGSTLAGRTVTFNVEGGTATSSLVTNTPATLVAGQWVRTSQTRNVTVAGNLVSVGRLSGAMTGITGQVIYGDSLLLETGSIVLPYFDGSTTDTLASPYVRPIIGWTGTAHGSTSYLKASDSSVTTALENGAFSYGELLNRTTNVESVIDEYVPLGVFRITDVTISQDSSGISLDITGIDRAYKIANNRWIEPYQITSGTNVKTAITSLLQDRYADIALRFSDTTATTASITLGIDTENDPWSDAQHIAETAGLELYFDADGYCVLEPTQDYSVAASVEQYTENEEAMVLTTNRTLSSDGVYNAVIVTGEGSDMDTPFRASAIDDNPASPTYAYGPFGLVPTFRSSPLIKDQTSANAYATATLNQIRGKDESLNWGQIVDPSLDAGDVVSIINITAKIARALIIDRLTIPLGPEDTMSAQGRTIVYQTGDTVVTAGGETVAVIPEPTGADAVLAPGGVVRIQSTTPEGIIRIASIQ